MLLGVKNGPVFGLVFRVWLVERLALLEVGSAQMSVPCRAYALAIQDSQ